MRTWLLLALAGCFIKPDPPGTGTHPQPIASRLAAGARHACWIDDGQQLRCWGDNHDGQLGFTTDPFHATARLVGDAADAWTWVAAGDSHTCGIHDSRLYCWGRGVEGQIDGTVSGTRLPPAEVTLPDGATPERVFAGGDATCAIDTTGKAFCWGGYGEKTTQIQAIDPGGGGDGDVWSQIALGGAHHCALQSTGDAYCWGIGGSDELGANDLGEMNEVAIKDAVHQSGALFVSIAANTAGTCAATTDGTLACWGDPAYTTGSNAPYAEVSTAGWTAVATGPYWVCGVVDGGVRCYGIDHDGALGNTFDTRPAPPSESLIDGVEELATGTAFACARVHDNRVSCWGSSQYGQLGNGEVATQRMAQKVLDGPVTSLAVGDSHTCATVGGQVTCFGDNRRHQIATDAPAFVETPLALTAWPAIRALAAGSGHTCGIDDADPSTIHCIGDDMAAVRPQVPAGEVDPGTTPTWKSIVGGKATSCGITMGGYLECWGERAFVSPAASWEHVAVGGVEGASLVVASQFDLNLSMTIAYETGDECSLHGNSLFPVFMTSGSIAALAVASGDDHACLIEVPGSGPASVACWGRNTYGQSGALPGTCRAYSTPARPVTTPEPLASAGALALGGAHSCALLANNALDCWGSNDDAAEGELIVVDSYQPARATARTFDSVVSSSHHTCGVGGATNNLYCWGLNRFGEVGNGLRFRETPQDVVTE